MMNGPVQTPQLQTHYLFLKEIYSTRDVCKRHENVLYYPGASMSPLDIIFNKAVAVTIIKLDNKHILHTVDCDTKA